jgi:glycine cleavage system protein P-like pyridoxal-binding family
MITYPSTYGIFDDNITDVINVVYWEEGQVYME